MFRISACAPLLLCAALALGQPAQNPGQNSSSTTPPVTYSGDDSQQQLQTSPQNKTANSRSQSDLQGALRACAVLLLAATSACPGETSQQQQPPAQPQTNFQDEASANVQNQLQNQGDLQSTLRACAVLLKAATSGTCAQAENASQQQPPQPQASPQKNPQDKASANSQILSNIQNSLNSDPSLSGADVQVSVDDVNITLTGSVQAQGQLDRVLALASPYVSYRRVVNKVVVH